MLPVPAGATEVLEADLRGEQRATPPVRTGGHSAQQPAGWQPPPWFHSPHQHSSSEGCLSRGREFQQCCQRALPALAALPLPSPLGEVEQSMLLLLHLPLRLQQGAAGLWPSSFSSEQRSDGVLYILSRLRTAVEGCLCPGEQQEDCLLQSSCFNTSSSPVGEHGQQGTTNTAATRSGTRSSLRKSLHGAARSRNGAKGKHYLVSAEERARLSAADLAHGVLQVWVNLNLRKKPGSWHKAVAPGSPSRATPHRSPAPLTGTRGRLCCSGCSQQHRPSHTSSSLGCPKASPTSSSPF